MARYRAQAPRLATTRFEMLREGLQECEARLFIEKALYQKKLDNQLEKNCRALLMARARLLSDLAGAKKRGLSDDDKNAIYQTFVDANWHTTTDALYAAAAEVSKKLGQ